MRPFTQIEAIAAPLPLANVDTDKILAGRFLKTISREGLGDKLFWSLRQDPAFVLNIAPWRDAEILIALENFGCGSSREHAPWALLDFGIRCVIAISIADIFYTNCLKNGILPIVLHEAEVLRLLQQVGDPDTMCVSVNLQMQTVQPASGPPIYFSIDANRKRDLMLGVDEISDTLERLHSLQKLGQSPRGLREWVPDVAPADLLAGNLATIEK